jgi:hypothetical protein
MNILLTRLTMACSLLAGANLQAHSPFIAPQAYLVDGNSSTILAGFAEVPFASEFALQGYALSLTTPKGASSSLNIQGSKYLTVADIDTAEQGSYKVQAKRDHRLQYVQVDGRWLLVMDSHGQSLAPLAERKFITPQEVKDTMPKASSIRHEQLLAFLSKQQLSTQVLKPTEQGLQLGFSQHPNALRSQQLLRIQLSLAGKALAGYSAKLSKQPTAIDEAVWESRSSTNAQGELELSFPKAGQYFLEINSPEAAQGAKPVAESYRVNVALSVD